MKRILVILCMVLVAGALALYAQRRQVQQGLPTRRQVATTTRLATTLTLGTATATPSIITVNTPTTVTVTVQITDPNLIPNSVNLLRLGATGTQPTILGVMHDDGLNGDAKPGDQIYSLQVSFHESTAGQVHLQVSAALKGALKRVISPSISIDVYNSITDAIVGVFVQYPPNLYLVSKSPSAPPTVTIQSTPHFLALGELPPTIFSDSDYSTSGYAITISSGTYTNPFDIQQWLADEMPDYEVGTITPLYVQGLAGYEITFAGGLQSDKPFIVVPHGSTVYTITYTSTFDVHTPNESNGVAQFNQIVARIEFLK